MKYKNVKRIIFICKYNVFRSKFAESYFKKVNKNKSMTVVSRGFIMGGRSDVNQRNIAKELGGELKGKSVPVNLEELKKADLIVVVASDIPKKMFDFVGRENANFYEKTWFWKIKDEQKGRERQVRRTLEKVKKKVDELNRKLKKANGTSKRI